LKGFISLPAFRGCSYRMYGGPYLKIPRGMTGVKMAAEINAPCEVNIPTKDFNVPALKDMQEGLLATITYILEGEPVYAGCFGGIGRTGLIMALVMKAWGDEDPVTSVRTQYYAHAVETEQQMKYVQDFEIDPKIKKMIFWAKVKNVFKKNKLLTNPYN